MCDISGFKINLDHVLILFSCAICSRQGVMDYITLQLAPRAADEMWNGRDEVSGMVLAMSYTV